MPKKRFGVDLEHTKYEHLFDMSEKDIIATLKKNHGTTFGESSDEVLEKQIKKFLIHDKISGLKKNKYDEKDVIVSEAEHEAYKELKETRVPALISGGLDKIIRDNNFKKLINNTKKTNKQVNQLGKALKNFGDQKNKADDKNTEAELKRLEEENKKDEKKTATFQEKKQAIINLTDSILNKLRFPADKRQIEEIADTVQNADMADTGVDAYLQNMTDGLTSFEGEVDKHKTDLSQEDLQEQLKALSATTNNYKKNLNSGWEFVDHEDNTFTLQKEKHQIKTKDVGNILESLNANELDVNEVGRDAIYEAPKIEINNDDGKKKKDKHKIKADSNKNVNTGEKGTLLKKAYNKLTGKKKELTSENLMNDVNAIEQTNVLDGEKKQEQSGSMWSFFKVPEKNKKIPIKEKKEEVKDKVDSVEKGEKKEEKKNMGENADNNLNNNNKPKEEEQEQKQINVPVGNNGNNTENKPAVEKMVENVGQDSAKKDIGSQSNNENVQNNNDSNKNNNDNKKEEEQKNIQVGNIENNTENKNENNSSVEKAGKNVGQDPAKNGTDLKPNLNNNEAEKKVDTDKKMEDKVEIKPANSDDNKKIEIKNNQEGQELEQAKEEKTESEKTAPKDESKNENNNVPDNKDKDKVENEQINSQNKEQNKEIKNNVNGVEQIKTDEEKNLEKGKNNESEAGKKESDNKDIEKNVDGNNNPDSLNNDGKNNVSVNQEVPNPNLKKNENNSKVENEKGANNNTEENKGQKNEVTESNPEKNENIQNNNEGEKPQSEKTEKKEENKDKDKNKDINKEVNDPIITEAKTQNTNINNLAENIVNGGQPPLVEAKNTNLKIANEAEIKIDPVDDSAEYKVLSQYEKSLKEHVGNSQVVKDSNLLRKSSECNEADAAMLNRSFNTLQEDEAEVRKYIPAKADNINISVPDLIKNQMRLEAGQMRPDEKKDHFENIIKMKGVDGDKYAKELVDYRLKVAEEAGREFEKKHQDPTKLSFLNKSANAIETIMCAMTRNPLGIMMMLAAAVYAPLLMVGLLAFTAWKRKRPNPAYQNAWQEQNRREMEAKRQQLATSYGCEASQISDREVKDALKQDYVQEKIIESMQAKLERDARKVVDSAAKDYAKAISKESGTKYSAKDLKDIAQKDLMRKDPRYGSNAATLSTQREDNLRQHIKNHEKKRKESGMGGRSM